MKQTIVLPTLPEGYVWAIFGPLPIEYYAAQILKDDHLHAVSRLPLFIQATDGTPQGAVDKAYTDFEQRIQA